MAREYWWTSLWVCIMKYQGEITNSFKKYPSTPTLACAFSLWLFHSFCPYMVSRHFFHTSIRALEQTPDTEKPKKGFGSPRDFQSHEIHLTPSLHGSVLDKKVSARPGPVSCNPLWWWGRRLTAVKGKDVAAGKRGKWWIWTEGEKERWVFWDGEGKKGHELWMKERLG